MSKNHQNRPHYSRYEGPLKVSHTAYHTPHTNSADAKADRDAYQLKKQRENEFLQEYDYKNVKLPILSKFDK